jgi:uncharacterized protein (DUF2235 family)
MAKNVIFCADGTWNGPDQDDDHDGAADPTNVFKLFLDLDGVDSPDTTRLANEQERILAEPRGPVSQVAKYLHGVGDSRNFLVKAVGGAAGAGLITRIVRGYTFISRNYAPGDRIFLIGFSRGAYTVRALSGLIAARGLLDARALDLTDKDRAYRLGSAVWFDYRRATLRSKPSLLDQLTELAVDLPGFLTQPATPRLIADVPIEAVAVWDTVGSLGIPQYTLRATRTDAFQFADTKLSAVVRCGLHAVAVDEQRADFTPTLWDMDTRVEQVLFPGAHSDVGGGYPVKSGQCGLSDGALRWMMQRLSALGVRFSTAPAYVPNPDCRGVGHQPWTHAPWNVFPATPRTFRVALIVDQSVRDRMACGPVTCDPGLGGVLYAPTNLPV